jgi:hypothetical protein
MGLRALRATIFCLLTLFTIKVSGSNFNVRDSVITDIPACGVSMQIYVQYKYPVGRRTNYFRSFDVYSTKFQRQVARQQTLAAFVVAMNLLTL